MVLVTGGRWRCKRKKIRLCENEMCGSEWPLLLTDLTVVFFSSCLGFALGAAVHAVRACAAGAQQISQKRTKIGMPFG